VAILSPGALWPKRPDALQAQLGYFAKLLGQMPKPNNFATGTNDGLNTAASDGFWPAGGGWD